MTLGTGTLEQSTRASKPESALTFVIVSWNAKEFLSRCVESIYDQLQDGQTEIIVVDNASTDGSVEMLNRQFPAVQVIQNHRNEGFAKANNIGIQQSAGDYIFLVNSDVVLRPDCIHRLSHYLAQHSTVGLVSPKILNSDLTLQPSFRPFPSVSNALFRALAVDKLPFVSKHLPSGLRRTWTGSGRHADIISGCFWLVRRAALTKVGLLDEDFFIYAEDKDWCFRFWKAGWEVVYLPGAEAIHYGGASSSRQPIRFYIEMHRANLRYWRKHHGWLGEFTIRAIMILHQVARVLAGAFGFCIFPSHRESILSVVRRCQSCARFLLGDASQLDG